MHPLQARRPLRHDRSTRRGLADKGNRLDGGVLRQRLAGFFTDAMHGIENAVGHAGLWTTVQPAASAGAIFQVDSMNGVFHGVITPTGPIGTRVEMFQCSSLGILRPSLASAHLSAKKRKFSAARMAALAMKRWA